MGIVIVRSAGADEVVGTTVAFIILTPPFFAILSGLSRKATLSSVSSLDQVAFQGLQKLYG